MCSTVSCKQFLVLESLKTSILSSVPNAAIFYKHLPLVFICHVVGTTHLYKCRPLTRFPPAVGKCDTN